MKIKVANTVLKHKIMNSPENSKSMLTVSRNHPTRVFAITVMNDALCISTGYME